MNTDLIKTIIDRNCAQEHIRNYFYLEFKVEKRRFYQHNLDKYPVHRKLITNAIKNNYRMWQERPYDIYETVSRIVSTGEKTYSTKLVWK
jgi:hypothetical protein